jgi:tetraacyldisaccharide 4'-kinase
MRQADVDRIWYDGEPAPIWMKALVPVYQALSAVVRYSWASGLRTPVRLPLPVVVVGNITAGGTGKTPLILGLIEALRERGWKPGVVSRGYGGSANAPMLLDADPDPAVVGDEPCLIRHRGGAPVAIGKIRPDAARMLLNENVDVILADDGLQNPSLARDIEICVIDGQRRFGNGLLLPAGPLRESTDRLQRVDFVVCNGGQAGEGEIPMQLRGLTAVQVSDRDSSRPLSEFAGLKVHAVAGVGNPQRFFKSLTRHGIEVIEHAFPDHHAFTASDIEFNDGLAVLMTEKDSVKCIQFAGANCWKVPVCAELPASFFDSVERKLRLDRSFPVHFS